MRLKNEVFVDSNISCSLDELSNLDYTNLYTSI